MLPCHNEESVIADLLREIKGLGAAYDTIVIDDASTDDTSAAASTLSPTIRLVANLGIGGAVQTGIKYARTHGYDFCIQIDGDGQHPPAEAAVLMEAYLEQPANMIVGSRYLKADSFTSSVARRLGNRIIGAGVRVLFGQRITDSTSGLRLMDSAAIDFFARAYPQDYPEPISIARALQHGLSVREVAVQMRSRQHGRSTISGFKTAVYMLRVLSYLVLTRLQTNP